MLERGEAIQTRLNFLQSRKKRKEQLQAVLERTLRKQHEQDEKLNKLFLSSQGIDAQINTLQSELQCVELAVACALGEIDAVGVEELVLAPLFDLLVAARALRLLGLAAILLSLIHIS